LFERAFYVYLLGDVGVNHGAGKVLVAQKLLDGAKVDSTFEEMGGKRVSEGVRGGVFVRGNGCSKFSSEFGDREQMC
jgi:hypothetical protein